MTCSTTSSTSSSGIESVVIGSDGDRTFGVRGVVEGFFGHQYNDDPQGGGLWSFDRRKYVVDLMAAKNQNTFVYAAKCDPKNKNNWREDYTVEEMTQWTEFVHYCQAKGITFIFGISPGASFDWYEAYDKDLETLTQKLINFAVQTGCRAFALCFDDGPLVLVPDDEVKFGSLGEAHAATANAIHTVVTAALTTSSSTSLQWYICPRHYQGPLMMTNPELPQAAFSVVRKYLDALNTITNSEFSFFWTGSEVVSQKITVAHARWWRQYFGERKLVIWDNTPVNDFERDTIFITPYTGREPGIVEYLQGILSNPMPDAGASLIQLSTIFDFLNSPHAYDPIASLHRSLSKYISDSGILDDMEFLILHSDGGPACTLTTPATPWDQIQPVVERVLARGQQFIDPKIWPDLQKYFLKQKSFHTTVSTGKGKVLY
ncbi:O-GlcNAcase NagJ [Pelomyxa schiedti]|nr:O-GlcNAcase NagJ [Pelomyxa schiedti]